MFATLWRLTASHIAQSQHPKYTTKPAVAQIIGANLSKRYIFHLRVRSHLRYLAVYIYSSIDILIALLMMCAGAAIRRGIQVLAETGGAVSALTPRVHIVQSQQPRPVTGSGKVRRLKVLLTPGESV